MTHIIDNGHSMLLGDRGTGVNNLPKVIGQICSDGNETHDLLITSVIAYRYATAPFLPHL